MKERLTRQDELKERFEEWGVRKVLFDVDSTLMDTTQLYRDKMREYCDFLAKESEQDREELMEVFLQGVRNLRGEFEVHPAVMEVPARTLAEMVGVEGRVLDEKIEEMKQIYRSKPAAFEGAVEMVEEVRRTGVDTSAVTHSGEEWTFIKLEPFRGKFEQMISTPVDKPKDEEQWLRAMSQLGVEPGEVMIVGDSIRSDIVPGLQLGVAKLVWVSGGKKWEELPVGDVYLCPEKPDEVIVIESIGQLSEAILAV